MTLHRGLSADGNAAHGRLAQPDAQPSWNMWAKMPLSSWLRQAEPGLLLRRGLILVGVLGAMAGVMIWNLDQPVRLALIHFGQGRFGQAWGTCGYWLGLGGVQLAGAAVLIAWALWKHNLRWRRIGIGCLWAIALSGIGAQIVKHLVGRPRPRTGMGANMLVGFAWDSDWHSFPSGHTAVSFALAAWLAAHSPRYAVLFYGIAMFISVGRILSGSHYASDVLGGMAVGLAVGWLMDFRRRAKEEGGA